MFNNNTGSKKEIAVALYAAVTCFVSYVCIFCFRKAFNVAPYAGYHLWGVDYKVVLVITQVAGYMLSKFYGIRFISELKRVKRGKIILLLVVISWLAWLLFALIPPPYNFWCLFFNGFPLGMLWGVIFSYVEGRRATDFIGASLAVSFIFGAGVAKSTAQWLMNRFAITEYWMPFVTGLVFFFPLLLFVYLLEKIPPPSLSDEAQRMHRKPMNKEERKMFTRRFLPGIIFLVLIYITVTILREVRDSFMADMWRVSGESFDASVFTQTETLVSVLLLLIIAAFTFFKNNFRAFAFTHLVMLVGFIVSVMVTLLFQSKQVGMFLLMTMTGAGLYMVYIPYNSLLFDRYLAAFKISGTVGFLIYLADSFGYLGSVGVLLTKTVFKLSVNWLDFYNHLVLLSGVAGIICTILSLWYHSKKFRQLPLS